MTGTFAAQTAQINNAGTLAATVNGIYVRGGSSVLPTVGSSITNSGTINAFSTAATVSQGLAQSSVAGLNVEFASNTMITNTGSILNFDTTNNRIGLGAGVIVNTSSGTTINNGTASANSGLISGGTGISLLGANNTTINNLAGGYHY